MELPTGYRNGAIMMILMITSDLKVFYRNERFMYN